MRAQQRDDFLLHYFPAPVGWIQRVCCRGNTGWATEPVVTIWPFLEMSQPWIPLARSGSGSCLVTCLGALRSFPEPRLMFGRSKHTCLPVHSAGQVTCLRLGFLCLFSPRGRAARWRSLLCRALKGFCLGGVLLGLFQFASYLSAI